MVKFVGDGLVKFVGEPMALCTSPATHNEHLIGGTRLLGVPKPDGLAHPISLGDHDNELTTKAEPLAC